MAVRILTAAAVVVIVGLLARSPATVARPTGPIAAFDKPTPLDRFLSSAGSWTIEDVGVEPFAGGPGAWTGRDLVVGFGPHVAARRDGRWRELPAHPAGAIDVGAVVAGDDNDVWVYAHRTCTGCLWVHSLYRLQVEEGTWTEMPRGPSVSLPRLLWLEGRLVLIGRDTDPTSGFVAWSLGTDGWRDLGPPPVQPIAYEAVSAGTDMVVAMTGAGPRRGPFTMRWNGQRGTWTILAEPPGLPRPEEAAMVWTGEAVVAVGGQGSQVGAVLSLATNTWTPLPAFPDEPGMPERVRRNGNAEWELHGLAGAWDGDAAVFVGDLDTPVHVAWSPEQGTWQARLATTSRSTSKAWWTGEELLLWGGFNRVAPLETLAVWSPPS